MALILKQEANANVTTPPAGSGSIFLNGSDQLTIKDSSGNTAAIPTFTATNNTSVFYNNAGALGEDSSFTFNNTNDTLTVANLSVTGTLNAGDISVSSIANGTSNVDIVGVSGNVTTSVAGNANIFVVTGTGANVNGTLSASGNITGNYFIGNGSQLTGIDATAIQNGTSNVRTFLNGNVAVSANGVANVLLVTGTGANVNGTANITGNANVGNLGTGGLITATGNVTAGNLVTSGVVSATGNVTASAVIANGTVGNGIVGGALTSGSTRGTGVTGQAYVTASADTGAAVGVRGYATDTHSGGYNIGVLGNALGSGVGNYAFYVQNGNIASIENTAVWDLYDNSQTALVWQSTGKANILGLDTTNSAEGVYTNGYLNVTGNASVGGIKTDNYYYANGSPVDFQQAGGSNTQVQFNDSDSFGGSANFTFDKATNILSVSGNIQGSNLLTTGTLSVGGNANVGNLGTTGVFATTLSSTGNSNVGNLGAGIVTATGTITGANLATGGTLSAGGNANVGNLGTTGIFATTLSSTGNSNVGNLGTGGIITATGTVTGGNLATGGTLSATGNANVGNLGTDTAIITTGNITTINSGLLQNGNSNITITANGNISLTAAGGTPELVVTSTGANVTGTFSVSGNANVGNIGATLFVGNISGTGNSNVGNLGTATAIITTGNITTINSGLMQNGNSNITIATGADITFASKGALRFTISDTTTTANGRLSVTGNANVGNLGTSGLITATGTITGGNLATGGTLSAGGNANVGNLGTTGVFATTLSASGNSNVGNLGTGGLITATGNITAGNLVTGGVISATGNANVGNIGATNGVFTNITGTLTTAAQPNITSVGTLTSLSVSGNANIGNIGTAGLITAIGNITGGNLVTGGVLTVTGTGVSSIAGNLDMTSNTIINLATPTNPTDAATKQYVDDVAQGLNIHDAAQAATPNTLASLSGGTVTYNNGSSGVGATLTTTGTYSIIDGVNVQTVGLRILVKNEANTVHNGIYTYTSSTVLTRATDYNSVPEVEAGDFIFVTGGTLYDNTGWVQTSSPATIGGASDFIEFTQFSGAGTYNAGTGLTLTGTTFSVNASQTQVTAVGTLTSLSVSGNANIGNVGTAQVLASANITAPQLISNVATGTAPLVVTSTTQVANLSVATAGSATTAGTVTTAAQPNITSVGTLTSLSVSGNINAGNVIATHYGNGAALETLNASNISSGTLAQARLANSSLTVNGTAISLGGSGTITANTTQTLTRGTYLTGSDFNGGTATTWAVDATDAATASKIVARDSLGSFSANAITASAFIGGGSGLTSLNASNISSGTLAQARLANSSLTVNGTAITLGSSGTITANTTQTLTLGSYLTGTSFNGGTAVTAAVDATTTNTASKVVARDTNGSFSANIITATLSGAATTAGTVTTAAQPNITSVGTLSSVSVSGNANVGNIGGGIGTFTGNLDAANIIVDPNGSLIHSINAAVSAAGTVQGNATALTNDISVVTTCASGAGVVLPTAVAGMRKLVLNTTANACLVYPASGGQVNSLGTNASYSLAAGARLEYVATSTTQWYTLNATYA